MLAPSALVATGAERAQRRRGHPGGRRLAVGAGHDDRAPAGAELAQDRLIQRHRDQAADHRAGAAAGHPRRPPRAGSGGQRDTSTGGDHPGQFKCADTTVQRPQRCRRGRANPDSCHPVTVRAPTLLGPAGRRARCGLGGHRRRDLRFPTRQARVISLAALALDADGHVEHVRRQPAQSGRRSRSHPCHGLTAEMLEDQPQFGEIVADVDRGAARPHPRRAQRGLRLLASWPPRPNWPASSCPSTASCAPSSWPAGWNWASTTCGWRRWPRTGASARCGRTTRSTTRWC